MPDIHPIDHPVQPAQMDPAGSDDMLALRTEVAELRAMLQQIRTEVSPTTKSGVAWSPSTDEHASPSAPAIPTERRTSRRSLLGAAAVATAATGAALLPDSRVANAGLVNGDPINMGEINECSETTEIRYPANQPPGGPPRSHMFAVNDGGWQFGVPFGNSDPEVGMRSTIAGFSANDAMHAIAGFCGTLTLGSSGGFFIGESAQSYGITVGGRRATMRLRPPRLTDQPTPPPDRFDFHNQGELTIDGNVDLWVCVEEGNPGVWRKLTGPAAAGAFHAISPVRVFDSRLASTPDSGRFAAGSTRVISVKDGRNVNTGLVDAANAVPTGATAVAYNLTVTNTESGGFAFIAPSETISIGGSSINWTGPDVSIANGGVVKLGGDRQLRVFCEASAADVILDITGYYR